MIEDTTNLSASVVDATEKKPIKRRIAVTALLALAALGAHHFHGRTLAGNQPETPMTVASVESENLDQSATGPNSLLGDACIDKTFSAPITADLGANELQMASIIDHAGSDAAREPSLAGLELGSFKDADAITATGEPAVASLAAVPEPATAGLLLMAVVPAAVLRRPGSRRRSQTSNA
jgi:hypothetical protein